MTHTIAVFLHHPTCSTDSVNGVMAALSPMGRIKIFTKQKILNGFFDDVDLVVFPGGDGEATAFRSLLKPNLQDVRAFMQRGGRYLGICMGAYWADAHYFGFLHKTRAVQYIKRPKADIRSSYGTTASVKWRGQAQRMYFYDGPTFLGGQFETVASYANGDPMAIVQGALGLIGCHLESQAHWYGKKVMQAHWHHNAHHPMLWQFVADYLLQRRQMPLF
ncbi:MAG: hypothetical protein EBQ82_11800 [Betaproteobacteria bacterium]|nr:hypothetical protein [Betaproteobacteria bacterium]NBY06042.1 hypothetical protein [Betaproteobacteria bacterium]